MLVSRSAKNRRLSINPDIQRSKVPSSEFTEPVFDITSSLYIIYFDILSPRTGQDCSPFLQLQFLLFTRYSRNIFLL